MDFTVCVMKSKKPRLGLGLWCLMDFKQQKRGFLPVHNLPVNQHKCRKEQRANAKQNCDFSARLGCASPAVLCSLPKARVRNLE